MSENFHPDLAELIRTIERDTDTHPETVILPLRQLLLYCHGNEQLRYAYERLGFAYLRLAEYRMSQIFYEQALALQPDNVNVLANLANVIYELGDKPKGVECGRRALHLKDELASAAGELELGRPHGGGANLISFSLYGDKARYCETAVLNCLAAKLHFPEFVCRFYVDQSVPAHVIERLRGHSAEVVFIGGRAASFPGTFWRFLALDEKDAGSVLVRDVDSIIDAREAYCVNEWIESGKLFHIIRDDCCHTELIHAGMFAARSGIVDGVEEKVANFLASKSNHPIGRYSDQLFLRYCVWPAVRGHAVTHDSVYRFGTDVRDVPTDVGGSSGARNHFIGANYANYRVQVSSPGALAENARYVLRLMEDEGKIVCEYQMEQVNSRELVLFLPRSYAQNIEAGRWGYEIYCESGQERSRVLIG